MTAECWVASSLARCRPEGLTISPGIPYCRPVALDTPKFALADVLLNGEFRPFVESRRAAGMSWRRIALAIRDETSGQVDITAETLRNWFAGAA